MKKTIIAAAAIVTMSFMASSAPAQTGTYFLAEKLNEFCQQKTGSEGDAICVGYVTAIADVMDKYALYGWSSCIPEEAEIGQLTKIVTLWLKNNPDDHGYTANSIVAEALTAAYPC